MRSLGAKYTNNTFAAVHDGDPDPPDLRDLWEKGKRKGLKGSTENTPK